MSFRRASLVSLSLVAGLAAGCSGGGGGGGDKNPVFVSDPVTHARIDIAYQSQLLAVDPQGKSVEYEIVSAPTGVAIDPETGLVTWTPTAAQAGNQVIRVKATDKSNDEGELLWNVSVGLNLPPTVYPLGLYGSCVGTEVTGTISAADPDGDPVTFGLAAPIAGFALDPSGTFTYTPEPEGELHLSILASDPFGGVTNFEQDVVIAGLSGDTFGKDANLALPSDGYSYLSDPLVFAGSDASIWTLITSYNPGSDLDSLLLSRIDASGCQVSSNTLVSTVNTDFDGATGKALPAGGLAVAWAEYDNTNDEQTVHAQLFDASGAAQWGAGGVRVTTTVGVYEYGPSLELAANGVLISWTNDAAGRIDAQKLNMAGAKQWGANGVTVKTNRLQDSYGRNVASDGADGMVIFWVGTSDAIVGQRLASANGAPMWGPEGTQVANGGGNIDQGILSAVRSGTDYFVLWTENDVWNVQKVDSTGAAQWGANGISRQSPTGYTKYYRGNFLAAAGGDLFHAWSDYCNVYVERLDGTAGAAEWQSSLYAGCGNYGVSLLMDGEEAVVASAPSDPAINSMAVVAQRYSSTGNPLWGFGRYVSGGYSVYDDYAYRYDVTSTIVPDTNFAPGDSRVMFTWTDERTGFSEIYLQHLDADGSPGMHVPENDD